MYHIKNFIVMKNLTSKVGSFVTLLSILFICMACSDDKSDPTPTPTPTLSVNPTSIELSAAGNSNANITVNAAYTDWNVSVTSGSEWLKAEKIGGVVSISVIENTETSDRNGTIVVTATVNSSLSCSISVTQKGSTAPFITVNGTNSAEHTIPGLFDSGKGGIDYKQTFKINSNIQWTLQGKEEWLNISSTSGNGEIDLAIYPLSENKTAIQRKATITLTGSGISATITVIQDAGVPACYIIPSNEVALYDCICWEYKATSNVNKFQYLLLSEREYSRLTDKELLEEVMKEKEMKYNDIWLSSKYYDSHNNRITSSSIYYFVSLASDKDGKYGELKKVKMETPEYYDADQDAYVNFYNFDNNSYQFQFLVKKQGYCDAYHVIYGIADEYVSNVIAAFEINYYLKYRQKHWLAKNDYYEWEIITNYPNDHTFSYTSYMMSYYPICFGYGWGVFKDGKLSSDLLGFQKDTSTDNSPLMRSSRNAETSPKDMIIKRSEVMRRAKVLRK